MTQPETFSTRPTLRGSFGMAASTHWLASQSAMAVLERGGNAYDAVVAGALVLQVVEPHLNGPGGDLVAIIAPSAGESQVLCGQGPAPALASVAAYRALGLELVPGSGLLAATVPGAFDAWLLLLRDHGTWEIADVAAYALHYSTGGYPVLPAISRTINAVRGLFTDHWPTSAAHWLDNGRAPDPGSWRTAKPWAATLERLVSAGIGPSREERIEAVRREWAEGFVADAIDRFVGKPLRNSSGSEQAGLLRVGDFTTWRASFEPPVRAEFRGHTIVKAGAWTQGPALLQALRILDGFDDGDLDPSTGPGAHLMLEAMKLAMADREAWYGDGPVPLDELLSDAYTRERRALLTDDADPGIRPGVVDGRMPRLPADRGDTSPVPGSGEPTVDPLGNTRGDTCHIDVVDRWGNLISATPSGGWLQSSPLIPELGFALGSRLQMTWLEEGLVSTLAPGLRPRSTLSPTIVERDSRAILALGTPGGDQQDQWQLPFLLRVLVGGQELQQAIDAPNLHSTSITESFWPRGRVPNGVVTERSIGAGVIQDLEARGHRVSVSDEWTLGRLSAVGRLSDGTLAAAANPRGMQGYAVGR